MLHSGSPERRCDWDRDDDDNVVHDINVEAACACAAGCVCPIAGVTELFGCTE
jgi:hypothetical protein